MKKLENILIKEIDGLFNFDGCKLMRDNDLKLLVERLCKENVASGTVPNKTFEKLFALAKDYYLEKYRDQRESSCLRMMQAHVGQQYVYARSDKPFGGMKTVKMIWKKYSGYLNLELTPIFKKRLYDEGKSHAYWCVKGQYK